VVIEPFISLILIHTWPKLYSNSSNLHKAKSHKPQATSHKRIYHQPLHYQRS